MPEIPTEIALDDKLALLSGKNFWETHPVPAAGIRSLLLADGPYGLRIQSGQHDNLAIYDSDPATCFPPGVAIGSSWDAALAARLGTALGREAAARGVDVVLGPGVNIKRSPLCGRNFEYYSEDPLISGVLGAAFTVALQAEGPSVSVKHFAANNQETNRQTISSEVDERTLREIYLPAFERVVREAQPRTVMASYNKINGVYTWANRWLLTNVLREEWGFEGFVMSDWSSVTNPVAAVQAGLDLVMPAEPEGIAELRAAIESGELDLAVVDAAVTRLAALASAPRSQGANVDDDKHHTLAQEVAEGCPVLLRNEHQVLPLPTGIDVAVVGLLATEPRYQGGGSAHVNPTRVDEPLAELRALVETGGSTVSFAPGYRLDGGDNAGLADDAVELVRHADVAVVFAGLGEEQESEGFDRESIHLPADQIDLIRRVAATAQRTVVVLSHGGVVSLEGWHDEVDAILDAFVLGQGGGRAIARLLTGAATPSGRLAETIPLRLEDHPSWLNFPGEQGRVRYGEGVLVGYRYFSTADAAVRYPFGYGLSYTSFETDLAAVEVTGDDSAVVTVRVRNTGDRTGAHVVQVYVSSTRGDVRRPVRELRAFDKVSLEPGEATDVQLNLDRRAFAYWDTELADWTVKPGTYAIQLAEDAATVISEKTIDLTGDNHAAAVTFDTPIGAWLDHPEIGVLTNETLGFGSVEVTAEQMAQVRSMTMRQFVRISGLPLPIEALQALADRSHPNHGLATS
ncbi:beta-glucosidase family protein [Microbacterium oleivorans]|uniref:Exo-alpha-(1->6)-L-arabinopyranosidase n=1 Tax=Microbacterium oleivorans TaxID=273677 RepID=A0A4R5YL09_9MICO|nr:glycoside hydrolase family 3 C-terminal domain-containing protein [Microbacterium oleivorans]TDL45261.1 beta-glucosidase [Microbacterium oleivorans]